MVKNIADRRASAVVADVFHQDARLGVFGRLDAEIGRVGGEFGVEFRLDKFHILVVEFAVTFEFVVKQFTLKELQLLGVGEYVLHNRLVEGFLELRQPSVRV